MQRICGGAVLLQGTENRTALKLKKWGEFKDLNMVNMYSSDPGFFTKEICIIFIKKIMDISGSDAAEHQGALRDENWKGLKAPERGDVMLFILPPDCSLVHHRFYVQLLVFELSYNINWPSLKAKTTSATFKIRPNGFIFSLLNFIYYFTYFLGVKIFVLAAIFVSTTAVTSIFEYFLSL